MRLIGHLKSENSARTLGDYLLSIDVRNLVEPDADGWAIWVISEDQIQPAQEAFADYLKSPNDNKFQQARQKAAELAEKERKDKIKFDRRVRTADQLWTTPGRLGPVTLTLIVLSVIVTALSYWNVTAPYINFLYISEYLRDQMGYLPEVRHGQIWRLITPIFIHFGLMHILFNMYVLRDFGALVESRRGSSRFIWITLFLGIGSNLGQYIYAGPEFGGMSGVLYGLLSYIWVRSRYDPASGLFMPHSTLIIMLVWFFLCLFGIIPGVANACHAVGLILGALLGAWPLARRLFS